MSLNRYCSSLNVVLLLRARRWQLQPQLTARRHLSLLCRREARRIGGPSLAAACRSLASGQVNRPYVDPKLSYAFGKSSEHLIYSTVAREFDRQIGEQPDEVALISHQEGIKRTYRQLGEDIDRLSGALVSKFNIQKGDTVGIFAYNCYNWILVQYACSRIGAVLTPINPSYKGDELAFVLGTGRVKCLFMPGPKSVQRELNDHMAVLQSDPVLDMLAASSPLPLRLESVILMDEENDYNLSEIPFKLRKRAGAEMKCQLFQWSDTQRPADGGRVFRSAQEADEAGLRPEDACILSPELVSPDDLFAIYYTSGTTGKPKGACCSQFTVINNVRLCQIRLRNGRPRNWHAIAATTLPLFHIFAGVLNALSPVTSRTTMVLSSYKYDIGAYVESIQQHEANITTLTPTMLIDLLTYVEQKEIRSLPLRVIQPGGASLPPELVARAFKALPELEELRTGYGSTENGAVATFQTIHEPEAIRSNTVGPPLDFTEVRVVKPANAVDRGERVLPLGEKGEIQTRGHNTMLGYLDQPDKTREVLTQDRWYRTGDIGFMHPNGSIEISGRMKHMIIKGGENIYPGELEQMMHKMDCIEKVHVIGLPDERFGEQVCAWVKLKPGFSEATGDYAHKSPQDTHLVHKEDIIKFCKANITYFKVPKYLLFVDDFPMTPTKKVQNHVMIERSIEIFGLNNQKRQKQ